MIRRETQWQDARGNVLQLEVAYLDRLWEVQVAVTEQVGPFETLGDARRRAELVAERLSPTIRQIELDF